MKNKTKESLFVAIEYVILPIFLGYSVYINIIIIAVCAVSLFIDVKYLKVGKKEKLIFLLSKICSYSLLYSSFIFDYCSNRLLIYIISALLLFPAFYVLYKLFRSDIL